MSDDDQAPPRTLTLVINGHRHRYDWTRLAATSKFVRSLLTASLSDARRLCEADDPTLNELGEDNCASLYLVDASHLRWLQRLVDLPLFPPFLGCGPDMPLSPRDVYALWSLFDFLDCPTGLTALAAALMDKRLWLSALAPTCCQENEDPYLSLGLLHVVAHKLQIPFETLLLDLNSWESLSPALDFVASFYGSDAEAACEFAMRHVSAACNAHVADAGPLLPHLARRHWSAASVGHRAFCCLEPPAEPSSSLDAASVVVPWLEVLARLREFSGGVLDDLDWSGVRWVGGAVSALLRPSVPDEVWRTSDVDLAIFSHDAYSAKETLLRLLTHFASKGAQFSVREHYVLAIVPGVPRLFQIFAPPEARTAADVLRTFDLGHAQFATDLWTLSATLAALRSLETRMSELLSADTSAARLHKAARRGLGIGRRLPFRVRLSKDAHKPFMNPKTGSIDRLALLSQTEFGPDPLLLRLSDAERANVLLLQLANGCAPEDLTCEPAVACSRFARIPQQSCDPSLRWCLYDGELDAKLCTDTTNTYRAVDPERPLPFHLVPHPTQSGVFTLAFRPPKAKDTKESLQVEAPFVLLVTPLLRPGYFDDSEGVGSIPLKLQSWDGCNSEHRAAVERFDRLCGEIDVAVRVALRQKFPPQDDLPLRRTWARHAVNHVRLVLDRHTTFYAVDGAQRENVNECGFCSTSAIVAHASVHVRLGNQMATICLRALRVQCLPSSACPHLELIR